ncbi:type II toxin-antitoxin system YafQ family toxin [Helicobacter didelphidarum]|uniref:Type II toxin-antitoxin system YafQ family toxin n=1 Tax=Helicobacter didelphidarum TaxID=2040648 RepID=A0A3D8IAD0_9HELI|nr:type II toxin-antitoxin system YafQ family toxin [Helicobacter didelphidarum]RDU62110.1 type II toxin-antitoxin system YafQ family toxin [Helicobacter didelphidarum]
MRYSIETTKRYEKERKKLSKENQDLLDEIIYRLANNEILEPKYKDHALSGNLKGFRDCHINPDLILIYEKDNDRLIIMALRVGSHSKVFK